MLANTPIDHANFTRALKSPALPKVVLAHLDIDIRRHILVGKLLAYSDVASSTQQGNISDEGANAIWETGMVDQGTMRPDAVPVFGVCGGWLEEDVKRASGRREHMQATNGFNTETALESDVMATVRRVARTRNKQQATHTSTGTSRPSAIP
ncbi:hypothetical protein P280DRAFT_515262 [Massarina eburnea CBS 473.64]|uniref:Uncharacterized protein n=1 Tax=Massarina eburnea CBS 473.64 TaxID=1395130 RepID=A0A6A6SAS3_9PLEO|nr:hypothetical protein P280DRAFT_515262 [Massarina eburnea CBS 473.64]